MSSAIYFPVASKEVLSALYVGKSIKDVPTPAAVMNVAAASANCERMLRACRDLDLGWRAHVKTHKVSLKRGENRRAATTPPLLCLFIQGIAD